MRRRKAGGCVLGCSARVFEQQFAGLGILTWKLLDQDDSLCKGFSTKTSGQKESQHCSS